MSQHLRPLFPLGEIQEGHHVQQIRLGIGEMDGLAAQALPQERPALVQPLVRFVAGHRVVGRRRPQKVQPVGLRAAERTANVIYNALVIEHGRVTLPDVLGSR